MVKCLPTMRKTWVQSLGWEGLLEKEMATHSSILAWKILWTEEPGGLQSMGSQRVRHNWVDFTFMSHFHPLCIFRVSQEPLYLSCHMHQLLFCLKHHDTNFMLLWPSSVDTGFSQRLSNLEKLSKFLQNFQPAQLHYEQRKQSHLSCTCLSHTPLNSFPSTSYFSYNGTFVGS